MAAPPLSIYIQSTYMVDSLVSIVTGLDRSLEEDSPERLTIREVYDSVSAGLKAKQDTLAPKSTLTDLIMLKLYAQALLKEEPYRKGKIKASEQVAETFHKTLACKTDSRYNKVMLIRSSQDLGPDTQYSTLRSDLHPHKSFASLHVPETAT
ncbi:hypothetical protein V8E54_015016 [Elaphomyces granulatus]